MLRGGIGVGLVEGVGEAHAFDGRLRDAVHVFRGTDAAGLKDRRHDVDHVMELVADAARVLDVARPGNAHPLPCAAEVRGDLLGPAKRRVEGPRPADGHVVVGAVGAPGIVEVLQLVFDRDVDAVEHGDLVGRADQRSLGAGAVVAADVDDERVVELAHVLHGLDHAADLVVGVGQIGGIDLDLPDEQLLLIGRKCVPVLQEVLRARGSSWHPAGSRRASSGWRRSSRGAGSSRCRRGACC